MSEREKDPSVGEPRPLEELLAALGACPVCRSRDRDDAATKTFDGWRCYERSCGFEISEKAKRMHPCYFSPAERRVVERHFRIER